MSDIPDELFLEILSRLPVAPLLRFRCVSKSWKGLIDSDEFTRHHLNHSRKTDSNLNIVLRSCHQLYSVDFDLLNETNMATFNELPHPLKTPSGLTRILGSCDGLLVLRNHQDDITILWNPSVKRFHVIPCTTSIEIPGYHKTTYGFGYDVMSDDYKFISIVQFPGMEIDEFSTKVQVYSLKSDSWRMIPYIPYRIDFGDTAGVLSNGVLHWIVTGNVVSHRLIAAFDLGIEEYRLVPLPKFADDSDIFCLYVKVEVLGGCLSLVCYDPNEDHVDLWVMKEYGVEESWSVLFSFDYCDLGVITRPLAYSKCGRKVLLIVDDNVLRWYDLDKKSSDVAPVQMPSEFPYVIYTCLQSLVLLNNGAQDLDLVVKTIQERKDKKGSSRKRKYFLA